MLSNRRNGVEDDFLSAELFPEFFAEFLGGPKDQLDRFLGRFQGHALGHCERGIDHVALHRGEKLVTHMTGGQQGDGQNHDAQGDAGRGVSPFDAASQGVAIANL